METKIIQCNICLEDKDTNIILQHINPTGDVSDHQMCDDCYKSMTKNACPFCRCEVIIPKPKLTSINTIDIDADIDAMELPNLTQRITNIQNCNYNRNITYDYNRIAAGLAWPDGSPVEYSN